MRYISSYKPKVSQVLLALGASLVMAVAGCSSLGSTSETEVVTVTVAAPADQPLAQEYDSFVNQVPLPAVELPPLPVSDMTSLLLVDTIPLPNIDLPPLPEVEPLTQLGIESLPLPELELPVLPATRTSNLDSAIFYYLPEVKPAALQTEPLAYDIFVGPNYTDKVVLTYDDCPGSFEQLLSTVVTAQANNIGLVLAPTGGCIEQYASQGQDIVTVMRQHGQYVINHSVSHPALSTLSHSAVVAELGKPGVVTNYGRPPYGDGFFPSAYSQTVANAYKDAQMRPWLWTVDTEDWKGKSASEVVAHAVNNSNQQDTVLMHMNHQAFNAESVLNIKNGLKARGLEVCSAYPGTAPEHLPDSLPC